MVFSKSKGNPVFERLEERVLLSGLSSGPLLVPPSPLLEGDTPTVQVDFDFGADYNNGNPPVRGLFRDLVGAANVNRGMDFATGTHSALNFDNGTNGVIGMTMFDQDPTNDTPSLITGNISLGVDVMLTNNKSDSPGLVALFNQTGYGKGLALVVVQNANKDSLQLVRISDSGILSGKNTLANVGLGDTVSGNAWYHLTMDVTVNGDKFNVTGKLFSHANPDGPVGAQIGKTLNYNGSLAARLLSGTGQAGMLFNNGTASSKASFTNLTVVTNGLSNPVTPPSTISTTPAPTPTPALTPVADPTPTPGTAVAGAVSSLSNGLQLLVQGTTGADAITISQVAGGLSLITAGGVQTFTGSFASIVVYGFAGDDTIRVTNDVQTPVTINTGDGNVNVYDAGQGSDVIRAGAGTDLLVTVGGGKDTVYGGTGLDSFWVDSTDTVSNVTSAETAVSSVHRITAFLQPTTNATQAVSLQIAGQNIVDPTTSTGYANFANYALFSNGPQYNDIIQGAIGDCYFVASLSAEAYSDPGLVRQMIAPMGDGSYAVRFYRSGQEVYVRVDADLPVYSGTNLVYAKLTPQNETWVALMEKAYAQFRYGQNSYDSLNSGSRDVALGEITGVSRLNQSIYTTGDYMAQYINTQVQAGHAVTAGTTNHAYMVKGAESINGSWYVDVYNPWGFDQQLTMADFQAQFVHGLTVSLA